MSLAYLDGQFLPKDQIRINPADYGFARGMTLFEFTRLYGGVPFRLDDHLTRFEQGAGHMGIPLPVDRAAISDAVHRIATANAYPHSGIKFYLTMGECGKPGSFGFKTAEDFTPHLIMIEDAIIPKHPDAPRGLDVHQRGIALKIVPFARDIPEAKTINYAAGLIATRHLRGTDDDEILYSHPDGYVTETTASNFFCVIDGALCTPKRGMLHGVTRIVMLELAAKLGIPTREADLTKDDLRRATESFITGSFLEMMSVRRIDDIKYTHTMDGPIFAALRREFSALILARP